MRSNLGWMGRLCALAVFCAWQVPGCAVTETGNPKSTMGFLSVAADSDDPSLTVTSATLRLSALDLLDCASDADAVAMPAVPEGRIDLVTGDDTIEWPGKEASICLCDVAQARLDVGFSREGGGEGRVSLRGDGLLRLLAIDEEGYALGPDSGSLLGYDLAGWLEALDEEGELPEEGALVVDGDDDPGALRAFTETLAPFVALYPDWDLDGVLDPREREAPLAVGGER